MCEETIAIESGNSVPKEEVIASGTTENRTSRVITCLSHHCRVVPKYIPLQPASKMECSQSRCKEIIPVGSGFKTCEKYRSISRLSHQKKRKGEKENEDSQRRVFQCVECENSASRMESEEKHV
jgi:hypothetical protein